jgi:hypothetical protein
MSLDSDLKVKIHAKIQKEQVLILDQKCIVERKLERGLLKTTASEMHIPLFLGTKNTRSTV